MFSSGGQLQTHSFQASDAFNKQQWLNCIRQAKEAVGSDSLPACDTQFLSGPVDTQRSDCSDCNMMDTVDTGFDLDTECPKMDLSCVTVTPIEVWTPHCTHTANVCDDLLLNRVAV